jgi:hydrogenase nickel incorporation protein HypB
MPNRHSFTVRAAGHFVSFNSGKLQGNQTLVFSFLGRQARFLWRFRAHSERHACCFGVIIIQKHVLPGEETVRHTRGESMGVLTIERKVLEKNDEIANSNREFFRRRGMFVINMVSSPGAGKTSILEQTIAGLKERVSLAVIEGDVQTDIDAQRVARYGVPVVQIVTNGGCHLEARLIRDALQNLEPQNVQLLVVENVGNLVCPANYDLGEAAKVVVASTTEGDDKPLKYPAMFRNASVLIINKIDLIPYLNCDLAILKANALKINPSLEVFTTSSTTGEGIGPWCTWLEEQVVSGGKIGHN